jgi:large repetitive protein
LVRTKSDAKGRFRLEGLGPGTLSIGAVAPGYGRASRDGAKPGRPIDLFLFPGASITGAVLGPEGTPVAGAVVEARQGQSWSTNGQVSAADGRYDLLGMSPGTYTVVARVPGLAPGMTANVVVGTEGETRADVTLRPGGRVTGRLVTSSERPLAGRVRVQEVAGAPLPEDVQELLRADAGADGRFQIEAAPPGSITLVASGRGVAAARVDTDVRGDGSTTDVGDVVLDPGVTIEGHVRDRSGSAIADANIYGWRLGRMSAGVAPQGVTDGDGAYALAGLTEGTYQLTVNAPGFARAQLKVEAGATSADVTLGIGGSISGTVVDDLAKPVESFDLHAQEKGGNAWGPDDDGSYKSVVAEDGRFTLEDVREGVKILEVSAGQFTKATLTDIKVTAGGVTDVGRIRLGSGGGVRGIVTSGDGTPVPGASVRAKSASLTEYGEGSRTQTDAQGSFELRGLQAGKVDVVASHPSFADGYVAGVDVDPSKAPIDTKIVLHAGGRVEGTARKRDGTPLSGVSVNVQAVLPEGRNILWGFHATPVQADGSFAVDHVPGGHVRVLLMSGSAAFSQSVQSAEADVRDGETTPVDFVSREILVSGRITRSNVAAPGLHVDMTGNVASMMSMSFEGSEVPVAPIGPQRGKAVAAEDGTYALILDAPGSYRASIESADNKTSFGTRQLDVPDAETFAYDADIGGAPLTGLVIDKASEAPVANAQVNASPKIGDGGTNARSGKTGADGRFQFDVAPGDYTVNAGAEGYAWSHQDLTVGDAGGDIRLALARGLSIRGRVMAASGQPAGGCPVSLKALNKEGFETVVVTVGDGSFEIKGLPSGSYAVSAGSSLAGFAMEPSVSAGASDLALTLQPGGIVQLRVRGADGAPVSGASAMVVKLGGVPVSFNSFEGQSESDTQGALSVTVPAGAVELNVQKDKLKGTVTVEVPTAGSAAGDVVLSPSE